MNSYNCMLRAFLSYEDALYTANGITDRCRPQFAALKHREAGIRLCIRLAAAANS